MMRDLTPSFSTADSLGGVRLPEPPDDDEETDELGPRDALALLRVLTAAVEAIAGAQTPADVYEGVCRSLAESGVVAAVLSDRGGGFYLLSAHRLGDVTCERPVSLPELDAALAGPVLYPAGCHPLRSALPLDGALIFPSIAAPLTAGEGGRGVVVSIFGPELGRRHVPAVETFASLLGSVVARVDAERRLWEMNARLEQRVRTRTEELTILYDHSSALCTATTDAEAVRLTARAAQRSLSSDVATATLCIDGHHAGAVSARGIVVPELIDVITARLRDSLAALSGNTHGACTPPNAMVFDEPPSSGGIALGGEPLGMLEAPVIASGRVVGVVALVNLQPASYAPEEVRLLYTVANQLGAAAERLSGVRSAERERLSTLMEGLTDGVALVDITGRILTANAAGREAMAALAEGEPGDFPEEVAALATRALAGEHPVTAELLAGSDPVRHITASAARAVDATGAPAVALTFHDATDEALMRERLFQSEKMASVGQLVSGVAHELNNPLTGIMGFAQLLLIRNLEPDAQREAATIFGEAERASKIVQNLLSFARRRRPEKVEVDLNALIDRVLELREYELRVNDIDVRRDQAPYLPACLADPHQIQQVLLNVITNAEQAIRSGPGRGMITVSTSGVGGYVRVTIADTGPGIAPEHLRRVFDPFFTTKPVGEGTGLGLTITYGIVDEHNGRISVENRTGGGAAITIELPVAEQRAVALPPDEPESAVISPTRTILVVDDEQAIQDLLLGILTLDGHQVETVRTGAEALDRVIHRRFDAVITDIRMPEMDGITFYRHVQERDPALARRIIFSSGDTVNVETRTFIQSTGIPFLEKPFKIRDVREMVSAIVGV
ncbi:MAG: response regulator [Chloroflexi bacterium]|nr:response regulator [Chloroflexota bacterium]